MDRNPCLGSVVSQFRQARIPGSVWLPEIEEALIQEAQMKIWDTIAKQNGYRNFTHVMALVEQRTCSRWVLFHLLK